MRKSPLAVHKISCSTILFVVCCAAVAITVPARQLDPGTDDIAFYRIEFNNRVIGSVVVVGCDNPNPPRGYSAGHEYWSWTKGAAWRGAFTLVPDETIPEYHSQSWAVFSHDHFDISHTVPMPAITPEASDRFYRVLVLSGTQWMDQGWMWLIDGAGRRQEWFGRNLTTDLVGSDTAIRFTSADPPAAGSSNVYLLIH